MPQASPERMRAAILRWWTTTYKAGQSITGAEASALSETLGALSIPELTSKYQEIMGADPVGRHLYDPPGAAAYDRLDEQAATAGTAAGIAESLGVPAAGAATATENTAYRNIRPPTPAQTTGTTFNPEETLAPPEPPGLVTGIADAAGGVGNAVMGALTAPFTPPTASAAPGRTIGGYAPGDLVPNQFNRQENQLSAAEAAAACGPAAAIAFARAHGRNPTWSEAADWARQSGWTNAGMGGPQNQSALLTRMGVPHEYVGGATNWDRVRQEVQAGNPVTISTGAHYFVAVDYDPASGRFDFGQSGIQSAQRNRYLAPGQITGSNGTLYTQIPSTTSSADLNAPTPETSVLSSDAPAGAGGALASAPSADRRYGPYDDVFLRHTPEDLRGDPEFLAVVNAISQAESGRRTDNPRETATERSYGLFHMNQMGGAGQGFTRAQLEDPEFASSHMVPTYASVYRQVRAANPGLQGAELASAVGRQANRPQGYQDANGAAANNYRAGYNYVINTSQGTGAADSGASGRTSQYGPTATGPIQGPPAPPAAPWMPPMPQGGLPSPEVAMGYASEVIAAAEAAAAQYNDDNDFGGVKRKAIMAAASTRITSLAGFMEMGQKEGYENANRRLVEARLSLDRDLGLLGLAQGDRRIALEGELGRERNRIDAATLTQRAKEHAQNYGLAITKLVMDDAWNELEFGLKERGVNVDEYRANLEGFGLGLRQWEMANGSYGDRSQAAIGAFSASNQAELGAFNANQSVESERRKLQSEYAQQVQMAGLGMRQEQARAQNLRNEAAPWALPDGAQFIPGFEPGGVAQQLAGMFGATAPVMDRSWTTQVNPEAGLQQMAAANEQSLAQHPGNPANLGPAPRIELDRLNGPQMPTPGGGPNFTLPVIQPPRGAGSPTRTMREQLLQMLMGGQ